MANNRRRAWTTVHCPGAPARDHARPARRGPLGTAVATTAMCALAAAGAFSPAAAQATARAGGRGAASPAQRAPRAPAAPAVALSRITARHGPLARYRVDLPYPHLVGTLTPAERRIDAAMRAAAERSAATFEREAMADRPSPSGPGGSGATSTLTGVVTTDLVGAGTVALTLDAEGYFADAAHGYTTVTTFDFDTGTGRPIPLASLFAPHSGWLATLSRASRAGIRRVLGDLTVASMLDPGTAPRASNFSAYALTPWGLRITFQDYQVAPYAAGTPTLTLPYASLARVARPGGPMAKVAADRPTRMALLPATTPPVVGECSSPIHFAGYVVPEPSRCAGGGVNADAWDAFALAGLRVLALGPDATLAQVRRAMCADDAIRYDSSTLLEDRAEALSAAYHGWRFGAAARTGFPGSCRHAATG